MAKNKSSVIEELTKKIHEGVKIVFETGKYQEFLKSISNLYKFSARNIILAKAQNPQVKMLSGYNQWQKLGRNVKKGEKSIKILAPTERKITEILADKDGKPILDDNGNPQKKDSKILSFVPISVFDVDQTEGTPIPYLGSLVDNVKDFESLKNTLVSLSPVPVVFKDIGINGRYEPFLQQITIKDSLPEAATIKTLTHEIAHAKMAHENLDDTRLAEVQAESVAYIVCQHLGIETEPESFSYIYSWSSDKETPELLKSLSVIQSAAQEFLSTIDDKFLAAELEQTGDIITPEERTGDIITPEERAGDVITPEERAGDVITPEESAGDIITPEERTGDIITPEERTGDIITPEERAGDVITPEESAGDIITPEERAGDVITPEERAGGVIALEYNTGHNPEGHSLFDNRIIETVELSKAYLEHFNGEPVVQVIFSESDIKSGEVFSLSKAQEIFKSLDAAASNEPGYLKTEFQIIYESKGEILTYHGQQDLGDSEGGLIDHIKAYHEYTAKEGLTETTREDSTLALDSFIPYLEAHDDLAQAKREAVHTVSSGKDNLTSANFPYPQYVTTVINENRQRLNNGNPLINTMSEKDFISLIIKSQKNTPITTQLSQAKMKQSTNISNPSTSHQKTNNHEQQL